MSDTLRIPLPNTEDCFQKKEKILEKLKDFVYDDDCINQHKTFLEITDDWERTAEAEPAKQKGLNTRYRELCKVYKIKRKPYLDLKYTDANRKLEEKKKIIETAKELESFTTDVPKTWIEAAEDVKKIVEVWNEVGSSRFKNDDFKKLNKVFWPLIKGFYKKKNAFFNEINSNKEENLKKKMELLAVAESNVSNTNWTKTTHKYIEIQKEWNMIGDIPAEQRTEITKRFRDACNQFFENKRKTTDKIQIRRKLEKLQETNSNIEDNLERFSAINGAGSELMQQYEDEMAENNKEIEKLQEMLK